jgi:hypothetical protein
MSVAVLEKMPPMLVVASANTRAVMELVTIATEASRVRSGQVISSTTLGG